jgi:hypothetical protein
MARNSSRIDARTGDYFLQADLWGVGTVRNKNWTMTGPKTDPAAQTSLRKITRLQALFCPLVL